jgi:hypothetical protein
MAMRIRIQEQRNWPILTNKPDFWFLAFRNGFCTYLGMFYDTLPILFMSKTNFLCRQSLTRIWIRNGVKSWIRIRIETNADPKHWCNVNKNMIFLLFYIVPCYVPAPCIPCYSYNFITSPSSVLPNWILSAGYVIVHQKTLWPLNSDWSWWKL